MPILPTYKALKQIALHEFADIIVSAQIIGINVLVGYYD